MNFKRTTAVFILNNENKVLMLLHDKTNNWLPPGGKVEEGELTHEAVIREAFEETGIKFEFICHRLELDMEDGRSVTSLPVPMLVQLEKGEGFCNENFVYIARTNEDKFENKEGHQMDWFTLDEAMELDVFPNVRKHLEYIKERYLTP